MAITSGGTPSATVGTTPSINQLPGTGSDLTAAMIEAGNQINREESQQMIDGAFRQAERNRQNRLMDETLQYIQDKFTQHKNVVNNLGGAAGA
jgi:hypothetical protein